jgi:hypothetical protein
VRLRLDDVVNATAAEVRARFHAAVANVIGAQRARPSKHSSTICTKPTTPGN